MTRLPHLRQSRHHSRNQRLNVIARFLDVFNSMTAANAQAYRLAVIQYSRLLINLRGKKNNCNEHAKFNRPRLYARERAFDLRGLRQFIHLRRDARRLLVLRGEVERAFTFDSSRPLSKLPVPFMSGKIRRSG